VPRPISRPPTAGREFTTSEWIDLLVQSIGFNPELFGRRAKLPQLLRLIPFVERNYNLVELGPKGTGKSHIHSEFSPHGMLISGGEVTVPKLFVNDANGRLGAIVQPRCSSASSHNWHPPARRRREGLKSGAAQQAGCRYVVVDAIDEHASRRQHTFPWAPRNSVRLERRFGF